MHSLVQLGAHGDTLLVDAAATGFFKQPAFRLIAYRLSRGTAMHIEKG